MKRLTQWWHTLWGSGDPLEPPQPAAGQVRVDVIPAFASTHLATSAAAPNTRPIHIFLPDTYDTAPGQTYPVLYANDGQDMEAAGLKPTLERLYGAQAIQRCIVVAIHATGDRLHEYGTAGHPNAHGQGSRADRYTRCVLEELIPFINAHYRTRTGPASTAIMGWSLGGLMAFDLAWQHPEVFGQAGAFSASFWWREADTDVAAKQITRIPHKLVQAGRPPARSRFWFEAGTLDETDDRDGNGVIDAIQDTTELMDALRAQGFVDGQDMLYVEVAGGQHHPSTWAQVLPDFLVWAFPSR